MTLIGIRMKAYYVLALSKNVLSGRQHFRHSSTSSGPLVEKQTWPGGTSTERYFKNTFPDYENPESTPITFDKEQVRNTICTYNEAILKASKEVSTGEDQRGDLYVGDAGIAYMFWKLNRCIMTKDLYPSLDYADAFINKAKISADRFKNSPTDSYAFLCGNAGIHAVSAAISHDLRRNKDLARDLKNFKRGVAFTCKDRSGSDEVLVGRAGYLAGCYWVNDVLREKLISDEEILSVCQIVVNSGRKYARQTKAPLPLMYQYHGKEYLGAAHGLSSILHMLLDSPWFRTDPILAPSAELRDIKGSVDYLLTLQDTEGNFPVTLDSNGPQDERLVHWCHGAPGLAYLFAKAYLVFKEEQYLNALRRVSDLVWKRGFLRKGPGICHGVAGNGYVFLLLYRLTNEPQYLYRAIKYMELLNNPEFKQKARVPDRPYSLYEGVAGTVCYLTDMLDTRNAHFPFMDVFH